MAKTNLQRKSSYYNRIIKDGKKSRHSVKYQRICTALDALVGIADKLKENPIERTALVIVGRVLGDKDFRESALYNPDYRRRFPLQLLQQTVF